MTMVLWGLLGLLGILAFKGLFSSRMDFYQSNVVLITVDSFRPDHLTPYGYKRETTPNLNKLAKDSSIFYYCYAQSSQSAPSIATLFTSLVPQKHGVVAGKRILAQAGELPNQENQGGESGMETTTFAAGNQVPLKEEHQTLVESFSSLGYATAGFSTNGLFSKDQGFGQGFAHFEDSRCRWGTAECVNEEVSRWLTKKPNPFFLWAHYNDLMDDFPLTGTHHQLSSSTKKPFPPEKESSDKESAISRYDAKLAYLDREIGKLIDQLKSLGLYENTVIAVVGTHGEELGEHGGWGHGTTVYNEQIHVPLIVKLPNSVYKGTIVETKVRQADVAPTLLEIAKAPPMQEIFGVSLVPDIQGIGANEMEVYSECRADGITQAVIERKYKLVVHNKTGEREFYNIKKDFREQKNAIKERQMDANRMHKRIKERFHL